jgi:hypothetical protein
VGCDIHTFYEERKEKTTWIGTVQDLDIDRSYSMFTALCGVRDYTGESPCISKPRGLPNDVTDSIKSECGQWDGDGHSHSYVSLREVKEFIEKNDPIKFSGLLTLDNAKKLDNDGILPNSWCQGSSDKSMVFREWEDNTFQPLDKLYRLMCNKFKPDVKPDDIDDKCLDDFRIVFWFDN